MLNKKDKEKEKNGKVKAKKIKQEDSPKIIGIKVTILAVVAIIIFSAAICPVTLQNDTYYTIKIGEHIVNTKTVDMQDPFSWHENLPYTYPHWAYDLMIYLIYSVGGFTGIFISTLVFSAILGVTIYFTNVKISKNRPMSFIITIGTMFMFNAYIAARAQLVTFILLELTILLIENFLETKKKRYAAGIILISIAIANLHCAVWPFFFVIFMPYVAEYLIYTIIDANLIHKMRMWYYNNSIKKYQKKAKKEGNIEKYNEKINLFISKIDEEKVYENKIIKAREERRAKPYRIRYTKIKAVKWLILIMVICAFTGLLTPLGDTPYTYLYKTMKGNTTENISEHLPLTLINNPELLVVITAVFALLIFTDVKIRLKDLFMLAGLAFLMFMTRRQESMFLLFGAAILTKMIVELFDKYDERGLKELEKLLATSLGTTVAFLIVVLFSVIEVKPKLNDKYVSTSTYPVEAAAWMKENLDLDNIKLFNEYNYGSYLLYQDIPVFIDSRADLYAPEFNGSKNSEGKFEGRDIFSDYIKTSGISRYYENTFEQYGITHIIVAKNSKLNMLISRDSKYTELYKDDNFVIYQRGE